ncbi:MAG: type II secretion system protein [Phycisphaeraceae bacterium JB051]
MFFRSRAFTLIELLVVISIIALLIGILLPALSSARHTAKLVVCGMRLKQVGVAIFAYGSDFKGQIPVGPDADHHIITGNKYYNSMDNQLWIGDGGTAGATRNYTGMGVLHHGYLENKQAFFCPDDDDITDTDTELNNIGTGTDSYGSYFYRQLDEINGDTRLASQTTNSLGQKPAVLAMDRQSVFPSIPSGTRTNHSNKASNLMFMDGRVVRFSNNAEKNVFSVDESDFPGAGSFPVLLDQLVQNGDHVGNGGSQDDVPNP